MTGLRQILFWMLGIYLAGSGAAGLAAERQAVSRGQLVYVPAYSHIYYGDRFQSFNLSVTMSIRNLDRHNPVEVTSVQYLDENGKVVRELVAKPQVLRPLAATRFFIRESDVTGGSEAGFLVRWQAAQPTRPPLISALMVGTSFGQGISFTTEGHVLEEVPGN